jgi:hypothetical protein
MLRSGGMDDRRGLRLRLQRKTTPGGKGGDTGKRNGMLCSGWMDDRRGFRPRLLFKTIPDEHAPYRHQSVRKYFQIILADQA